MSARLAGVALAALTVVMCVIGVVTLSPPAAVPADAPAAEFSAHRALGHLETIAREPHPVGSAAHAAVRSYITSELRALDVEPHLQSAVVGVEGSLVAASVVNVLARVEGTGSGKAVMLVGHYDSVPGSPGAGDDGAAVAAMLETLRAILAGPPLSNDVILLFTDAEELGLLGARAFVEQHTWLDDVGLVLNLESRGTRGVAHMFETSEGNGRLVPEFLRVAKYPAAQSISYEIYKMMPNDTDYSVFRRAGLRGLNFAFIEGGTGYHTAQDSLERLDPGSLQHIGDYALTLARHFGNADLERDWGSTDAVYFNLLGPFYVTYPASWVHPVALLLLLGTAGVLIRGLRAGCLSPGRLALGFVINLAGAAVVAGVMWWAADRVDWSYQFELWFGWASGSLTLLALLLVACGLTVAIHHLVAARFDGEHLLAGGWVIWTVLLIALGFTAPGATYLIALPLALSLAAGARWLRREPGRPLAAPLLITLSLCIAVAALLWAPLVTFMGVALGEIAAVLGGATIFLLLCGLLTPLLDLLRGPGRGWVLPVVLALLGVGL